MQIQSLRVVIAGHSQQFVKMHWEGINANMCLIQTRAGLYTRMRCVVCCCVHAKFGLFKSFF